MIYILQMLNSENINYEDFILNTNTVSLAF